ncbi:UNVERIFIED_CONTAM: nicotinate-nucleotide adenylyltransferase [Acetivibrio alkalicellulosi]
MKKNKVKIGVLGGTFDPIHNGHLIIAERIREEFKLDKVLFIPSGNPPHKTKQKVTQCNHRLNMVCEALKGNPFFEVSSIEIKRMGYTYTVDTIEELRGFLGDNACIYYLIGADVLFDLLTWKDYESVFKTCEFIATLRPGNETDDFAKQIMYLESTFQAKINKADIPLVEISSTEIRQRVNEGKSIKYLIPESVEKYIKDNKLYVLNERE